MNRKVSSQSQKGTGLMASGKPFQIAAFTLPGYPDPAIAVAASRAGGFGVLDFEFCDDIRIALHAIETVVGKTKNTCGIKLDGENDDFIHEITPRLQDCFGTIFLTLCREEKLRQHINTFHKLKKSVFVVVTSLEQARLAEKAYADGVVVKGNEAAGFVGEKTSFILLQEIVSEIKLPVWVQGGIGLHTAAACCVAGASGIVLDSQLALTHESPLPEDIKRIISKMDGRESVCVGIDIGQSFRVYGRPGLPVVDTLVDRASTLQKGNLSESGLKSAWREYIREQTFWGERGNSVWLIGQDVAFADRFAKRFGTVGSLCSAIRHAIRTNIGLAKENRIFRENAPLAVSHDTKYPIVQGPMARISDNAAFAFQVADAGGLPVIALSKLNRDSITKILRDVAGGIGTKPWGIGILGFNESALLKSQIEAVEEYQPKFAVLAGGIPSLAETLESKGIRTYVHVQSADLLHMFIDSGIKRFIFEGRECGGHIGPRSSFVLWEDMISKLLEIIGKPDSGAEEFHILFAGGIHDALSAGMVACLASPLVALGVRVGVLMGTAYLLTDEILKSGAIVGGYQRTVLECTETHVLESGPGHEIRCCNTPAIEFLENQKAAMKSEGLPADEVSSRLDKTMLGRLRIAAKGVMRSSASGRSEKKADFVLLSEEEQHKEGVYMVGQLAALRNKTITISDLHHSVAVGSSDILSLSSSDIFHQDDNNAVKKESSDIAIIGMACLLPKAGDIGTYWENILHKRSAITEIPPDRWDWRLYYDKDRNAKDKIYSKWGGFLDDLVFDPTRYGLPPKSIESIDPMQLMALEVARRTLVDAGYEEREFDRERTSVIIGASGGAGDVGMQYGLRAELPRFQGNLPDSVAKRLPDWTEDTFAGILLNVVAGRIANRLNLGGVNFATDAACASSFAALYQAVNELIAGRSDMVITGGVDTVQGPFGYLCFSKTQALSPRGICCTFDASADGIVISEGIAMVALKRLEDAERDGDRIYAVIKGIGGSSDGRAKGLSAPLPEGQLRAFRRAYTQAGFGPDTVGLFEAHGTGTVSGDTAELESTTTLLREAGCRPHQAAIGSVKTMIGHTKATAGIAGLIKAALSLQRRVLPPHFGVSQPNQALQKPDSLLYLVDEALPWLTVKDEPRRAAASAFGFGGTNFHVVLEEYTGEYRSDLLTAVSQRWPAELLVWNAADRKDLTERLRHMQQELTKIAEIELRDLAYNLAKGFRMEGEILAIVSTDRDDLTSKIGAALMFLSGDNSALLPGIYHSEHAELDGKVAVLFPGQGSQYPGMLRELALHFPIVAETLSEADELLSERFSARFGRGKRLSHYIFPRGCYSEQAKADAEKSLTGTDVAQPALGAIEAGLWNLMRTLGFNPDMLGGHSYGEFAAFFAGDVLGFDDFMSLSEARGRFIVDAVKNAGAELGTMAAVKALRHEVERVISGIDGVVIANHNAPEQCVISGSTAAIQEAMARITEAGWIVSRLPVAAAFHSRFVEPAQAALANLIGTIYWRGGRIPVYSNTTGEPHANDMDQVKKIMTDHLVNPVEFLNQIEAMYRDGARVFFEVGPKTVLTKLVGRILEDRPHKAIAIEGNGRGINGILHALGQLLCAGVKLDLIRLFDGRGCNAGDPADLTRMKRSAPDTKHAWMLNGSSARRATEPVRQVGISLEETERHSSSPTRGESPSLPQPDIHTTSSVNSVPKEQRKENLCIERSGQTPVAGRQEIMAEYFDMMRQFLESQERIMLMYMGKTSDGDSFMKPSRTTRRRASYGKSGTGRTQPAPKTDLPHKSAASARVPVEPAVRVKASPVSDVREKPASASTSDQPEKIFAGTRPANELAESIGREKMADMLRRIIEEKTGYPPDMVGLSQNLEADLGIDSIKRIEIVGTILKLLPPGYKKELGEDIGRLNTQPTLNGILDILEKVKLTGGTTERTAVPLDQVPAETLAHSSDSSFRHIIVPEEERIDQFSLKRLNEGLFLITQDTLGIAEKLSELLRARGRKVIVVGRELLKDDNSLNQWCVSLQNDASAIAGIIHLAQIGSDWLPPDTPIHVWQDQLQVNEKSLFILLHNLMEKLKDNAHILSASALGGIFNRHKNKVPGLSLQGGAVGLLKSLHEECPGLRVKAIDIDPGEQTDSIAKSLMDELELAGGRQEVGYPGGKRTIFRTVTEPLSREGESLDVLRNMVVLATGGSRGVTAELVRELALPGNTIILTGRSPLHEEEAEEVKFLKTPLDLRQYFISKVREGFLHLTPAEIHRKVQSILAAREMRNNINDFRQRGAVVEYYAVDVTNDAAMRELFDIIYDQYAGIGAVVHGAGVIEDKLLADKTGESWSRVVETKVIGLLLLQKYLRPESLRFFTVLSSVAGRYGNSGQTDYATANELMNRLCCQLNNNWGNKVIVRAFCWGPWGPTMFGTGMVTEETEAKFAQKGVILVNAEAGRRLFKNEVTHTGSYHIEVVCGIGPWEEREAAVGEIEMDMQAFAENPLEPLLNHSMVTAVPGGEKVITLCLGDNHAYLREHCIDNVPVVPAAVALEIMSEAASHLWPDRLVVEARDCQLLKGIELKECNQKLSLVVSSPTNGGSDNLQVSAAIRSEQDNGMTRIHYRTVLHLKKQVPRGFTHEPRLHNEKNLDIAKAYNQWLFHGPRFQVIDKIYGLSDKGASALLRTTSPAQWLTGIDSDHNRWIFDPAIVDAAAQMVILWTRTFRDETPLPTRFGRVVRYAETLPDHLYMDFERITSEDAHLVRGNVYFSDAENNVLVLVEDMECVSSAELNRLGGTAKVSVLSST